MKKFLVPAVLVLGLIGVAAAGAVGVHRISNGQCPLTGRQIHCLSSDSGEAQKCDGEPVVCPTTGQPCQQMQEGRCSKKRCQETEAEKPTQKP